MTGADYIVDRLASFTTRAFGVYGAGCAHLFDAVYRRKKITMVCTAGEQGAGFAAEGHAKARNGIGLVIATSGPGALNLATSVANCFYDSVPVLFLCGQVSTKVMRSEYSTLRQRGFQECPTIDVLKPVSKYAVEVKDPAYIGEQLENALHYLTSGRPGPVVLSLPLDVLAAEMPPLSVKGGGSYHSPTDNTPSPAEGQVSACLAALALAERPVILVGGGCRDTVSALQRFAETVGVPVVRTWNALDIAPDDWPLYAGNVGTYGGKGRNFAVQQADFALVLGCRLSGRITGGNTASFLRGARAHHGIWHVDVDSGVLADLTVDVPGRNVVRCYLDNFFRVVQPMAREGIAGDPRRQSLRVWRDRVSTWREAYDPCFGGDVGPKDGVNPYQFIRELSKLAPSNAVVVSECGGNAVIFHQAWESKTGQRIFSSHGGSAMGQGLGLAIGAAIACPDRPVIAVIGDGGFTLSAAELNTIRIQRERLANLRVFVLNNKQYGITRAWQKTNLNGRTFACGPEPETGYATPDIAEVVSAYGVNAGRYVTSEQLITATSAIGPVVVDVPCPGWDTYEPNVRGWDRPIEEMQPSLPAAEFLANMRDVPPLDGWKARR